MATLQTLLVSLGGALLGVALGAMVLIHPEAGPYVLASAVFCFLAAAVLSAVGASGASRSRSAALDAISKQSRDGAALLNRMLPLEATKVRDALLKEQHEWLKTTGEVIKRKAKDLYPQWEHPPVGRLSSGVNIDPVPDQQIRPAAYQVAIRLEQLAEFIERLRE